MIELLKKFEAKLVTQGICEDGRIVFGALDDDIYWNASDGTIPMLKKVIEGLNIASILFAKPAEPYFSILNTLADYAQDGFFVPEDSETRTFFHDIPVNSTFDVPCIVAALKRRRSIYIKNRGIITYGTIGPEQAFVVYNSVCFSSYVKFFSDILHGTIQDEACIELARREAAHYQQFLRESTQGISLQKGSFNSRDKILSAMIEAGRETVRCRLVDSYFGNISYFNGTSIFISQTASSLDELAGAIDECPLDGSSCAGITASSEFTAHREIFARTNARAVLHGHPKFSVIMSMQCDKKPCAHEGECHRRCPERRWIGDVPIVPGEIGTGTYGLCRTLPPALEHSKSAIVYGHGLFTTGEKDFSEAFDAMARIEMMCADEYLTRLQNDA